MKVVAEHIICIIDTDTIMWIYLHQLCFRQCVKQLTRHYLRSKRGRACSLPLWPFAYAKKQVSGAYKVFWYEYERDGMTMCEYEIDTRTITDERGQPVYQIMFSAYMYGPFADDFVSACGAFDDIDQQRIVSFYVNNAWMTMEKANAIWTHLRRLNA